MLQSGYILLILAVIVAALGGVLLFAVLRLSVAARRANRRQHRDGADTALLTGALQDAVGKLREQERATQARAEASERLSGEIIASLTSGLLVVGLGGEVWILNPSGERLLGLSGSASRINRSISVKPASRSCCLVIGVVPVSSSYKSTPSE